MVFVLGKGYHFSREQVAEALEGLIQIEAISSNRTLIARVIPHYISHPKLSFGDCCLAEYAKINDAVPLWAFDKELAS